MPLKNIELRHGGRYDSFIWRIEIPSNKKRLINLDYVGLIKSLLLLTRDYIFLSMVNGRS